MAWQLPASRRSFTSPRPILDRRAAQHRFLATRALPSVRLASVLTNPSGWLVPFHTRTYTVSFSFKTCFFISNKCKLILQWPTHTLKPGEHFSLIVISCMFVCWLRRVRWPRARLGKEESSGRRQDGADVCWMPAARCVSACVGRQAEHASYKLLSYLPFTMNVGWSKSHKYWLLVHTRAGLYSPFVLLKYDFTYGVLDIFLTVHVFHIPNFFLNA